MLDPNGLVPVAEMLTASCAFPPSPVEVRPALGWGIRELLEVGKDTSTVKEEPQGPDPASCLSNSPSAAPHRQHQLFRAPSLTEAKQNALSVSAIGTGKPGLRPSCRMISGGCSASF